MIDNKIFNFISLYRSPSQTRDEFDNFKDLELILVHIINRTFYYKQIRVFIYLS